MEIKLISLEDMQNLIERQGSQRVWQAIEKIASWKDRIANRNLFFMVKEKLDENQFV